MEASQSNAKGKTVLFTIPEGFKAQLEKERQEKGYRSVAQVIREKLGCPEPGTKEWEELLASHDSQ